MKYIYTAPDCTKCEFLKKKYKIRNTFYNIYYIDITKLMPKSKGLFFALSSFRSSINSISIRRYFSPTISFILSLFNIRIFRVLLYLLKFLLDICFIAGCNIAECNYIFNHSNRYLCNQIKTRHYANKIIKSCNTVEGTTCGIVEPF